MDTEVVSDQAIEDRLTEAFVREEQAARGEKPEPKAEPEPKAKAEPTDESTEDAEVNESSDTTDGEVADDFEEFEFEGEVFKAPKKLKEGVLRQKDYTQKSQLVAEERRMLEERSKSLQAESEFKQQHFAKAVELHGLQQRVQQFSQLPWDELAQENPQEYLKLDRQYREAERSLQKVHGEVQGMVGQFEAQRRENLQKAQAQCLQELKKDIPVTAELLKELDTTGQSFGFKPEELAGIVDPRHIRVLHAAMQWKKLQASKASVEKKVQTAKPVQVQAARTSQTTQQNAKEQELRNRMRKSGKSEDAEALLAMRFAKASR